MSLLDALQQADLLLIDGLHAWQFEQHPEQGLSIECMDGRQLRRWQFSPAQLAAAEPLAADSWRIAGEQGTHELVCLAAVCADDDEPDDEDEAADGSDDAGERT